jgi:hypothetical protein
MKRTIKIFGLALAAALMLTAVAASAAHAAAGHFTAESYPVTVVGINEGPYEATLGETTVVCSKVEYHAELTGPTTGLKVTPTFEGCTTFGFIGVVTRLNGCSLENTAPEELVTDVFEGRQHLVCPPNKVWETEASGCIITYAPQKDVETFVLKDHTTGKKRFTELDKSKGKKRKVDAKSIFCPVKAGEFEDGEVHATFEYTAEDAEGNPVGVYVE